MKKNARLSEAEKKYAADCKRLDVSANLEDLVFGSGNPHAKLMLIGEAPGANEAAQGVPFVGRAGAKLDELLAAIGLQKDEIYVTNAVKYRPITSGKNSNRTPSKKEIEHGRTLLQVEIDEIDPEIIVTLGNTPLFAVTGDNTLKIGEVHGSEIKIGKKKIFPLYHPASAIYNRSLKQVLFEDMSKLGELLA